MKRNALIVILGAILLAGSVAYGLWRFTANGKEFVASGLVEVDDIHVGSKVGGRVLKVLVKRGQNVKAGEVLVQLEAQDLNASLAEAQAMQRQAEAKLAMFNAGFRSEEIDQAEAAVKQAQAEAAQAIAGPRQQELAQAEAEWKAAQAQAENARKFHARMEDLAKRELIAKQEYDDAVSKADEAAQKAKAAREHYDLLRAGTRKEEIERVRQKLAEAEARRRQLRSGFRKEEIAQARSEAEAARARVDVLRVQLDEAVIKAPVDAQVESLDLEPGDLVGAGKPVATLLRVGSLYVRAYVPEGRLGAVRVGDKVRVGVDSYPGKDFTGVVRRVSRQGEFTPRNVQTHEERALQVFQTEVTVEDGAGLLRPGMAADVRFQKP